MVLWIDTRCSGFPNTTSSLCSEGAQPSNLHAGQEVHVKSPARKQVVQFHACRSVDWEGQVLERPILSTSTAHHENWRVFFLVSCLCILLADLPA
jgi:hypothetical protein